MKEEHEMTPPHAPGFATQAPLGPLALLFSFPDPGAFGPACELRQFLADFLDILGMP